MHQQSLDLMARFAATVPAGAMVLDVGSRDVNGTFRELFPGEDRYIGIDIEAGSNVDVVVEPYRYPFADGAFSYIISGSALEHVRRPWVWIKEIGRILRPGGQVCVIVPYSHQFHEHPVDCWRVFPDGLRELFLEGGLVPLTLSMHDGTEHGFHPLTGEPLVSMNSDGFCDTFGIATK